MPPPLNLAYVASSLKGLAEIEIIDCYAKELGTETCLERVKQSKPDIVGVIPNNYCDFVMGDLELWTRSFFSKLKSEGSDAVTVAGGPFASVLPERILSHADFVLRGDQEVVFKSLIENLGDERRLKTVKGLGSRIKNKIHINKPYYTKDLDSLPFPARELLETNIYNHILIGRPMTTFITARGCPYRCVYCSRNVYGPYRERSVENVFEELKEVVERNKIKNIVFYDDNFTINKKRTMEICDLIIKENLDMRWVCATRVDLVDSDLLERMNKAGCSVIAYGVESGDQRILKELNKDIKPGRVNNSFEATRKTGIKILSYIIIGSPGETTGSLDESFRLMMMLKPDYVQFNPITSYPGSEMYGRGMEEFCGFTEKELESIQKELYKRYYLRFGYVFNQIKKIRSFGDIRRGVNGLRFIIS